VTKELTPAEARWENEGGADDMVARSVNIRRVHAKPEGIEAGSRVLVDRLWPRGVRKDRLGADEWLRELGPSDELRKWFGHDPKRWKEFERRYRLELRQPQQLELLRHIGGLIEQGPVTLLYPARDEEHNQAVVLRSVVHEMLEA
jgi:uncharacterized protein YeaO (DUF488 family)